LGCENYSDVNKRFSEISIFKILIFVSDNISVVVGGRVLQQTIDITMDSKCYFPLAELLLYSARQTVYKAYSSGIRKNSSINKFQFPLHRFS
jgi:hypothetical protein